MKKVDLQPKAIRLKSGEGERHEINRDVITIKLDSAQTFGLFSLIERTVIGGFRSPPQFHAQSDTDWACYILSGRLEFTFEGKVHICGEGEVIYVPRGTYFRWGNPDPTESRALFFYTPGRFEGFFREIVTIIRKKSDRIGDYGETLTDILAAQDRYGMVRLAAGELPEGE